MTNSLDREIAELRQRLDHLENLRYKADRNTYQLDTDQSHGKNMKSQDKSVSWFLLILGMGVILVLILQ